MKFRTIVSILLLSTLCLQLNAAPVKSKPTVKYDFELSGQASLDEAVMKLLPKNSQLIHMVTEGVYGPIDGSKGPNINIIYRVGKTTPVLLVLVPVETGKYKKVKTELLKFGKSDASEVYSVFFAQADKDKDRELFILCEVFGKDGGEYMTAVFDMSSSALKRMPVVESKIKGISPSINVKRAMIKILGNK